MYISFSALLRGLEGLLKLGGGAMIYAQSALLL